MAEIKETKEAVVGLLKLTALLAKRLKDGLQADDVSFVFEKIKSDEVLSKALLDAYNGIEFVPSELSDLSLGEFVDLFSSALPACVEVYEAVKG